MSAAPTPASPDGAIQPQHLEAEENVIGAMLISEKAIVRVAEILDASDFYRESHGMMFRSCLDLWAAGTSVDTITLAAELERRGQLERCGGRVRVHEITNLVPASANVAHWAQVVREMAFLRGLIRAGGEMAQMGWQREGTPGDLMIATENLVDELRHRQRNERERDSMMTLYAAAEYLDAKFKEPPDETAWIPGPWSFLAHGSSRLGPGRLYTLGGYAKDGKTAAAVQFFVAAVMAKVPSTYLTLEMSKEDLAERVASSMGLPAKAVQSGRLAAGQEELRKDVLQKLAATADYGRIWDAPGVDVAAIRAHVKTLRPELLVVDHLHEFHLRPEYERQDLEATVRGLHRIAREFNMTILLLAQLSRSGDKKHPFPPPTMSALKGSGAIEQLAWAVWFVYRQRDENNLPTTDSLFICAANRSGSTGTKRLTFWPREVRYLEVARDA